MADVNKAVVASLIKAGKHFEILVDCDKALEFKAGKNVTLDEVVVTKDIYFNLKKGDQVKVSKKDLQAAFATDDESKIIAMILKKGEVQLTSKHREQEREAKRKQLLDIIHVNAVDSKTGYPHPRARIERALEESKFRLNDAKGVDEQVESAVAALRELLPIKFEKKHVAIKIPSAYAGRAQGSVRKHKVIKEEWLTDGSYYSVIEIPSGILDEFFDELNKISHGQVESKILKVI